MEWVKEDEAKGSVLGARGSVAPRLPCPPPPKGSSGGRWWKQASGSQGSLWLLLAKPLSNARWEASAKSERLPTPSLASPPETLQTKQKLFKPEEGKEEGMGMWVGGL